MNKKILKNSFLEFCEKNKFEKNKDQLNIIKHIGNFLYPEKSILNFFKSHKKNCFYLYGDVGSGKTMLLDFVYTKMNVKKNRIHFNEFMINFHNFRHNNQEKNMITSFSKKLKKKYELILLDEFQVTNIVDAMILGKLFESILSENIKILITSNIKINDLYKDGLQRNQFLPFISIMKKKSIEQELTIDGDYRKMVTNKLQRAFFPINEKTSFKINQLFRELTKNKIKQKVKLDIKGREFIISNFYDGIARFKFDDLCNVNIGSEDYLKIADYCRFIIIENIPFFDDEKINQQQRFITLIDILYEKKISLMISMAFNLKKIGSSKKLQASFKRTLSRLYELTLPNNNFVL